MKRVCKSCGQEIDFSCVECPNCGAVVKESEIDETSASATKRRDELLPELDSLNKKKAQLKSQADGLKSKIGKTNNEIAAKDKLLKGKLSEKNVSDYEEIANNPGPHIEELESKMRSEQDAIDGHIQAASVLEGLKPSSNPEAKEEQRRAREEAATEKAILDAVSETCDRAQSKMNQAKQGYSAEKKKYDLLKKTNDEKEAAYKQASDLLDATKRKLKNDKSLSNAQRKIRENQVNDLERAVRIALEEATKATSELDLQTEKFAPFQEQYDQAKSEYDAALADYNRQKEKYEAAQAIVDQHNTNNQKLDTSIKTENSSAEAARKRLNALQAQKGKVKAMADDPSKMRNERNAALKERDDLKSRQSQLNNQLKATLSELDSVSKQVNRDSAEISNLEYTIKNAGNLQKSLALYKRNKEKEEELAQQQAEHEAQERAEEKRKKRAKFFKKHPALSSFVVGIPIFLILSNVLQALFPLTSSMVTFYWVAVVLLTIILFSCAGSVGIFPLGVLIASLIMMNNGLNYVDFFCDVIVAGLSWAIAYFVLNSKVADKA